MARATGLGLLLLPLLLGGACHGEKLISMPGTLSIASPGGPAMLEQPDAGVVRIAFGDVLVGTTASLTLSLTSVGTPIVLGALTAIQADSELDLPPLAGAVVGDTPSLFTVSFSPTSAGAKSAVFELTEYAPQTVTVRFELSGEGTPYALTASPNPFDFGLVGIGQSLSAPLTIRNTGTLTESFALSPSQGRDATLFNAGPPYAGTLAPGQSETVQVTFSPVHEGAASASFTAGDDYPGQSITVGLSGTGVADALLVTPLVSFGYVQIGDTAERSATVTNLGAYATVHLVPVLVQPSGPFSLASGDSLAVVPGQTLQIPLTFAPASLGAFSGTLDLVNADAPGTIWSVDLEGFGGGPRIACAPYLVFSPTLVGAETSAITFCTNTGVAIPSLPDLGLQISQAGLSTDDAAFVPNLILPDAGLAGAADEVELVPGQSAFINVAFRPADAGAFVNRLTVTSNDTGDADAGTLLLAQSGEPGLCELQVKPPQLSFGEVAPGALGILPFELRNAGRGFCAIAQVSIGQGSDAAFSLLDGGYQNLVLTDPGSENAPNPSSFAVLQAEFAPAVAEAAAVGIIDVTTANGRESSISLSGESEPACLYVEPADLDFGTVRLSDASGQLCSLAVASVSAFNACAVPVTLNRAAIASGLDAPAQFRLSDAGPSLPLTLAAGEQASFTVQLAPTGPGDKLGALTIATSEFADAPFLVTLEGVAEPTATRTDTFMVYPPPATKVDLLLVLDEDDDRAQIEAIAKVLPPLIDSLNRGGSDYQIAVTSTDTCDKGSSDRGSFEPCDHCIWRSSGPPTFITPGTPTPAAALVQLVNAFDVAPQLGMCEGVNGDEHFFDSIADAFAPDLLAGHNAGFIRDGAYLAVLLVNGDDEDDGNNAEKLPGAYPTGLAQLTALLQGLKPDPASVSVSYVNQGAGSFNMAQRIGQLVKATGGIEIDTTDLTSAWEAKLINLLPEVQSNHFFHLSARPAPGYAIQVFWNGMPTNDWGYDPFSNELYVSPGTLTAAGVTLTVTYVVGCL